MENDPQSIGAGEDRIRQVWTAESSKLRRRADVFQLETRQRVVMHAGYPQSQSKSQQKLHPILIVTGTGTLRIRTSRILRIKRIANLKNSKRILFSF